MSAPSLTGPSRAAVLVQRVAFAHPGRPPLLVDVDLQLGPGWTGLVGENGAGKTTLLRLLAHELAPTEGRVVLRPPGALVVRTAQDGAEVDEGVRRLAADPGLAKLRGLLRLRADDVDRFATLSAGERRRFRIAGALARAPAVLLVDEPTDHLDDEARAFIVAALRSFRGVGVVVSHDRALLAALTTTTLRVHHGRVTTWPGSYEQAKREWELTEATANDRRRHLVDTAAAHQKTLADARRDQGGAAGQRSAGSRMKDRHDHDASGGLAQGRVTSAEKRLGRKVAVARRAAERAGAAADAVVVEKTVGRPVALVAAPGSPGRLLSLDADALRAGERTVLRHVHVVASRADRVHVQGPNGAGKSTLLAALLATSMATGRVPPDRVLYLPQELPPDEGARLLAELRRSPPDERGRALTLVAALGVDPARVMTSTQPSPGEARKLALAAGLARPLWLLVLDEPTNHLDLPSVERLIAALRAFPGALVMATHDGALAAAVTTSRWRVHAGSVRVS